MTLVEIVNKLKKYAEGQFNNPTVMVGSVYENMNTKELRYPCINFDNVNVIKRENDVVYSFYVYYADRLNEDASNQLEIQSQAMNSLQLILHNIYDSGAITLDEFYNAIITPFKLKFVDVCAGAWMQINVHATNGLDYCDGPSSIKTLYITTNGNYDVEDYERVDINVPTVIGGGGNYLYFEALTDDASVYFGQVGDPSAITPNLQYSYDASNWTDWDLTAISVPKNQKVYFKGINNSFNVTFANYYRFSTVGNFNLGGDVRSILDENMVLIRPQASSLISIFSECNIIKVNRYLLCGFEHVNHTCFHSMFSGCTLLENAPDLPFDSIAEDRAIECYNAMFFGCTSLRKAPELPSRRVYEGCYRAMFAGCSSLNYIKCLAVADDMTSYCPSWVDGVASSGTFVKAFEMENWEEDNINGIPQGWTIKNNEAPIIPLYAVEINENGLYTAETGGWSAVTVNVDTASTWQSGFDSGFTSGHTSGFTEGYASGYSSGYTDGYSEGYHEGYEDGEESVPLSSTSITENGTYENSEGGWSSVTVDVQSGITPTGVSEFTDNGTYDVTNDATAIVNIDKQALIDSGYTSGYTDGFQSGFTSGHTSGFTEGYQSGRTDGFNDGYTSGHTDGVASGYSSGYTFGYGEGFDSGFTSGHTSGFTEGYQSGHTDGVESGFTSGWTSGFSSGYTSGSTDGFQNGYASGHTDGYAEGQASVPLSSTAFTANDTYTKAEGGWNSVTVNVPSVTTQTLTQAQYDALQVKDPMVIYLITE